MRQEIKRFGWQLIPGLLLGIACLGVPAAMAAPPSPETATKNKEFLVHEGDVWVMVGDSITCQNLYTVYLEAFIRARYPKMKLVTVNSGKSGEVFIGSLIRFRDTVAAFKPTLVTVNYGMNDHTKTFPGEQDFLEKTNSSPQRFVDAVRKTGARLVMCSASPMIAPADYATDGGRYQLAQTNVAPPGWRSNPVNKLFADKLSHLADRNQVPFVDQMTALQEIWGANYSRDRVAALRHALHGLTETNAPVTNQYMGVALTTPIRPFLGDPALVEQLPLPDKENITREWAALKGAKIEQYEMFRQYLKGWAAKVDATPPPFVQVSGCTKSERATDLIHPNEAGHLCMAAVLLKKFNADGLVSEVSLDAKNPAMVSATKAVVREVSFKNGGLSFKRLDESLPFPVDPLARPLLDLDVPSSVGSPKDLLGLSRYMITVKNLPVGTYTLAIDGVNVTTLNADQLASGFNAGLLDKGPVADQTARLLEAVRTNSISVFTIKGERKPVTVGEPKIFAEAQPVEHEWTLKPVKNN